MAAGAYREPLDPMETQALLQQRPRGSAVYEHIIQAKTGALFAAAAELGAVAADAPPEVRAAAAAFGARLGEAYQMADDLADLVSPRAAVDLSPQQSAALQILMAGVKDPAQEEAPADAGKVAADLAGSLQRAIRQRVRLARQALETFPEGPRLPFLRALPGALVMPEVAGS
jgi:geranylgeranyl pyrophosphate synthase